MDSETLKANAKSCSALIKDCADFYDEWVKPCGGVEFEVVDEIPPEGEMWKLVDTLVHYTLPLIVERMREHCAIMPADLPHTLGLAESFWAGVMTIHTAFMMSTDDFSDDDMEIIRGLQAYFNSRLTLRTMP